MATQFASLTPTVRFPAPRQTVRIAYSTQSSLGAIADALTDQPTPVVEATLEELAGPMPLRELVAERNALMATLATDTSVSDADGAYLCRRINTLERQIIAAEALTADDVVMKLLTLAQIANDHTLEEGEADNAIAATRQFFGIGYSTSLPANAPLGMPQGYNPFMRGPWIAWQKAYGRFIEADRVANSFYEAHLEPAISADQAVRSKYPVGYDFAANPNAQAELDAIHYPAEWDRLNTDNWCNRSDTIVALLKTPAPSPAELAVKLKLFTNDEVYALDTVAEVTARMAADARRFGGQGAYLQPDRALLAAVAERVTLEKTWPDEENDAEWTRHARRVRDNGDMVNQPALTVEGVLAKLKVAFTTDAIMAWTQHALTDPSCPEFRKGLRESGGSEPLFWSAIEDLARIAGIDLGGPAASLPSSEHSAWLNERNDLLEQADRSEADVSDDEALSRINRLDARIINTPATSAEDVIAKLVMAIEVQAEGANIASEEAAVLVREAKAHLGVGYVYTAEVAA